MTATQLDVLRAKLCDLYIGTHGYLSTDKVDEEPRTRQMKRTYAAPFFAIHAAPLCSQIANIRVNKEVTDIPDFANIFESEMRYFERLRFFSESLDAISRPFIAVLTEAINFEGTLQVVDILDNPETLSLEKIQKVFSQIDTTYQRMGCPAPAKPMTETAFIERAIKNRFHKEITKAVQDCTENLNLPIEGVDGEMLPGITIDIPSKKLGDVVWEMGKIGSDVLRRIRFEFRRRIAILKEHGLLEKVLDDSSLFSKTPLRRRLENLRIRHDTIQARFYSESLEQQKSCLSKILNKTQKLESQIVWFPPLNLTVGSVTDEMSPHELESVQKQIKPLRPLRSLGY